MFAFRIDNRLLLMVVVAMAGFGCGKKSPAPASQDQKSTGPAGAVEATPAQPTGAVVEAAVPFVPRDMRHLLDEAFDAAREGAFDRDKLAKALVSARSCFATIPVPRDGEVPVWTKVRLNTQHASFDAIRFTNPFDYPVDLVWAFAAADARYITWNIVDQDGRNEYGFPDFHPKENLKLPGLDLSRNAVSFQQLDGGHIAPGREYFIWFVFGRYNPVDLYVRLKLLKPDPAKRQHFTKAHPIAELLGLEVPFQFTEAATLAQRAMDVSDCRGPQAAMEFLEKKLAEASDRSGEFAYAWLAHGCAMQLAKDRKSREKATLYYQKTVDSMRKFRDKYRQLTSAEQNLLQVALYNEACLLATSGQPEKALAVLREALKAGFRDLPHILSDEDLRSVRDLPAFDALLKEQDERR